MKLISFDESDYETLYGFMYPLWHETYDKILPGKQIDFLLGHYFSDESVKEFRNNGYRYFKIVDGGEKRGVVVICEKYGATYLDKLYLTENSRGKGYAAFVFSELLNMGKDIVLNVNQANVRALKCYKKNGFYIEEEQEIPLENGMVNKDYKMRLTPDRFRGNI